MAGLSVKRFEVDMRCKAGLILERVVSLYWLRG